MALTVLMAISCLMGATAFIVGPVLVQQIQADLGFGDEGAAAISAMSLLGLQLTLFAGIVVDKTRPWVASLAGLLISSACWVGVSFIPRGSSFGYPLVLLCLISFGGGAHFLAIQKTAMSMDATGGGITLGLCSMCMTLSLAVAVGTINIYGQHTDCVVMYNASLPVSVIQDTCWRGYTRVFGIETAVAYVLGLIALWAFRPQNYPWLMQNVDAAPAKSGEIQSLLSANDDEPRAEPTPLLDTNVKRTQTGVDEKVGFGKALTLWIHPQFWAIFLSFLTGVGAPASVLLGWPILWRRYIDVPELCPNGLTDCVYVSGYDTIASSFSYVKAGANLVGAILVSALVKRGVTTARKIHTVSVAGVLLVSIVLSVLVTIPQRSYATLFALATFLTLMSVGFGVIINVAAIVLGDLYGYANFGVFFSFLQIGGAIAAIATPFAALGVSTVAFSWAGPHLLPYRSFCSLSSQSQDSIEDGLFDFLTYCTCKEDTTCMATSRNFCVKFSLAGN